MESWIRMDAENAHPTSGRGTANRPQQAPTSTDMGSERVFGVPGASLQNATALGADARSAGIDGEKAVAAKLQLLAAAYRNTYVFHSVKLPGAIGDIDHLVVQGNRILLVDSKNWRVGSDYVVHGSEGDSDYVSRDGQPFEGGAIHLRRQMRQWAKEFADAEVDVRGALVVANSASSVSKSVGTGYSIANLDGLSKVFAEYFAASGAPPLRNSLLARLQGMLQMPAATTVPAGSPVQDPTRRLRALVIVPPSKVTRAPIVAMVWCFLSWTVLPFPLAGISAVPLIVFAHFQQARKGVRGGSGLLVAVLIATYCQLALWLIFMAATVVSGSYRPV